MLPTNYGDWGVGIFGARQAALNPETWGGRQVSDPPNYCFMTG